MNTPTERRILKKHRYSKFEQIRNAETGIVHDVIEGPLKNGSVGRVTMRPADQTRAGLARQLMDCAFILPSDDKERDELFTAIRNCDPRKVTQYAKRNGWGVEDRYFIIGERVIGNAPKGQCGLTSDATASSYRIAEVGSLEQWKLQVAAPALNSSAMIVAIAAGFAASLLKLVGMDSMACCFSGPSRSGKTVTTRVGASVAGWLGAQPLPNWDTTEAGLDDLLALANDLLLPIDDLMTLEGSDTGRLKRVVALSYKLASGRGRARHHHYEREHGAAGTWRTIALTSNEKPLAELSHTYKRPQGASVRLIDLPVVLKGHDIFDGLRDGCPAQRAKLLGQIAASCLTQHGTAITAFLQRLLATPDAAKATIDQHMATFSARVAHFSDGDLTRDLTRKFGLLYAAARFASAEGIVDWPENRVEEALTRAYRAAREQLPDEGKLLRDGCAALRRALRSLPRASQIVRGMNGDDARGYRYRTAQHYHCWLRNETLDRLLSREQRELVEQWLRLENRLELVPARKGGTGGTVVKRQHYWMGDRTKRVRAVHIIWPRQPRQPRS